MVIRLLLCEQPFDPTLRDKPVVVLSNNDGCMIACSALTKEVGIKMRCPWHLIREEIRGRSMAMTLR
ncbi:hypothetical protein [Acidiphilium sp.]|uniref:Y-family DNA polymerase n=1 Tax=Acidiphilium sp. TaxID=527 RepID=UPI003D023696